jgi:hypothetical protein
VHAGDHGRHRNVFAILVDEIPHTGQHLSPFTSLGVAPARKSR